VRQGHSVGAEGEPQVNVQRAPPVKREQQEVRRGHSVGAEGEAQVSVRRDPPVRGEQQEVRRGHSVGGEEPNPRRGISSIERETDKPKISEPKAQSLIERVLQVLSDFVNRVFNLSATKEDKDEDRCEGPKR
jgi:hypothetical protein